MSWRQRAFRIGKWAGLALLAICLLIPILIQVQQRLFRYRAKRLRDDFRAILLHKSTWQDAQALMHRWGAWGHYDGVCTATNCKYEISMPDLASSFFGYRDDQTLARFLFSTRFIYAYVMLGGHLGSLQVRFIFQDRLIGRTSTAVDIYDPPKFLLPTHDDSGVGLVLIAQSRDSLRASPPQAHWILGGNDQLADHPTYKVGRPGGCTGCLLGEVTYSPDASQEDIRKFTDYNFNCFTSMRCTILEDLLPAAKDWHLYDPPWGLPDDEPQESSRPPAPCRTSVWALGRDATAVAAVDVLSDEKVHLEQNHDKRALKRIFQSVDFLENQHSKALTLGIPIVILL